MYRPVPPFTSTQSPAYPHSRSRLDLTYRFPFGLPSRPSSPHGNRKATWQTIEAKKWLDDGTGSITEPTRHPSPDPPYL